MFQACMMNRAAIATLLLRRVAACLILAALVGHASAAFAQKRIGLVIGNARYWNISGAPKAEADARGVAQALNALGFYPVTVEVDLSHVGMSRAIDTLVSSIENNDLVVFYFAGNGVTIDSQNFLLPVDVLAARAGEASRVTSVSLALDGIIASFRKRGARVFSIIDASHDNPFDRPGAQPLELKPGLAQMSERTAMTYELFSASPNETARARIDGNDPNPNSVFGRVLISQLAETAVSIGELASNVQAKVRELAQRYNFRQTPVSYDNGLGAAYLSGRPTREYADNLKVRSKPDGSKRFKLSEIANIADQLPVQEDCELLGQKYSDQLRREGGDSVRFWVRKGPGNIGYCQRTQNRWFVEYYDRDVQDALILDWK